MTDQPRSSIILRLALAGGLALGAGLGGCYPGYTPGGPLASLDQYTYESTREFPQTITLVEIASGETLWTVDVPIGKQLVVRFFDDFNTQNAARPALMRWRIMDRGKEFGQLENSMPVPPAINRRLVVTYRPRPDDVEMGSPGAAPTPPAPATLPPPEPAASSPAP